MHSLVDKEPEMYNYHTPDCSSIEDRKSILTPFTPGVMLRKVTGSREVGARTGDDSFLKLFIFGVACFSYYQEADLFLGC